jgi:iron complex outermembrane receptor protein
MTSGSKGGDTAFPGGEIGATEHERIMGGGGYGLRLAPNHELAFNVRRHHTDDTGNPSLPLDIRFFDTTIFKSNYNGDYSFGELDVKFYYTNVDHQMDNVTLRALGNANPRRVDAASSGLGWSLGLERGLSLGTLTVGFDGHLAGHQMNIRNPRNSAFFVDNFEDVDRDRFSAFGEWNADLTQALNVDLGVRVTRVEMRAGRVGTAQAPGAPPVQRLVAGFNQGDRDASDTNLDVVAKLAYTVSDRLTLRLEGGRKTRSPSYIERFAWLPIEATAGLADGNNHIGQVGLDPEVAHEVGVGFDWTAADSYFRPRLFYRNVDDYITGTPFDATPNTIDSDVERVSNVNGDATPLIYSNTGAEFYGFDVDFGYRFTDRWRVDGQVALTRAERTDIDDNIYRVPPANGRLRLTHTREGWNAFVETELMADEDRISETNFDPAQTADPRTEGHALLNIGGSWRLTQGAKLRLAVNNLVDDRYNQPLGGFNRVPNSDVGLGDRLPGAGRSFFVGLNARF